MAISDARMRALANAHTPKYDGNCLPTFFRFENLCALGVPVARIEAFIFEDESTYDMAVKKRAQIVRGRRKNPCTLECTGRFKERSNMVDRQPEHWPVHTMLQQYLEVRPELQYNENLPIVKTFKDQLILLEKCEGWDSVFMQNDRLDQNFIQGLHDVLQLHYFGIGLAEMRQITQGDAIGAFLVFRTIVTNYVGAIVDPQDPKRGKVRFAKAIPKWWGVSFPLVYQVPASEVAADIVFTRLTKVNDDFNNKLKSVLADSDDDEDEAEGRIVGEKNKSGTYKLSVAQKRSKPSTIQSNDVEGSAALSPTQINPSSDGGQA